MKQKLQIATFLIIFIAYLFLLYRGVSFIQYNNNAILLFIVSILIPIYLLLPQADIQQRSCIPFRSNTVPYIMLGLIAFLLLMPGVAVSLHSNPLPTKNSDVILQMQVQFERFIKGEQPYAPVTEFIWNPFPVYMPLQWLPIGFGKYFNVDIRWGGLFILFICYAYFMLDFKLKNFSRLEIILISLTPLAFIWLSNEYRNEEINSVFDVCVYAYYFLLGYGLLTMNHKVIFIGLVGAMMSRYTAIFWLPIFLFVIYQKYGKQKLYQYLIFGSTALLVIFILPFLVRDPDILTKGLAYHNACGILEWERLTQKNEIPFTVTMGASYIQFWAKVITGLTPTESVTILRLIQLLFMAIINLAAYLYYKKHTNYVLANPTNFLLSFMAIEMLFFYGTSALVVQHYWFTVTPILWACMVAAMSRQTVMH